MEKSTKIAVAVGGGVVGAVVIAGIWEHLAHAAPNPPAPGTILCPDGTPAPGGLVTNCAPPHPGQNPYSPPGGWQYSGNPTTDYLPSAHLLLQVDPCACSSVGLVRRFQAAAGLVQAGQSDGRYGPDVATALASAIQDMAAQGFDVSGLTAPVPCETSNGRDRAWWGPTNTAWPSSGPNPYMNPGCPGDPGPTYA